MFAKIENAMVEIIEVIHASLTHIVGEVIDLRETDAGRERVDAGLHLEIDIVDGGTRMVFNQINETAPDTLDRRYVEFHRADSAFYFARAGRYRIAQRAAGVFDAKRHGAGAGSVRARELLRQAIRFGIDDEIDVALPIQRDVFRPVARDAAEAHGFKQQAQLRGIGSGVLDELKAVGAQGILP